MRLPNFLVVGAPRTGTTSMYRYLSEHPEVYLPAKKELHYFTHDYLTANSNGPKDKEFRYCQTLDEYKVFFQRVPSGAKAVGDISPSYLFFPQCIPRIKDLLGENVKIMIMLRNPIERTFSNYLHMVRLNRETLTFVEALQAEEDRLWQAWRNIWLYKRHSLYADNVQRYLEAFGPSKVRVILNDDFSKDTLTSLQGVYRFLGITAGFVPKNINIMYARSGAENQRPASRPHPIKSLAKRLLPDKALDMIRNLRQSHIPRDADKAILQDEQSIAFLRQYFKEDIDRLEKILNIDLSRWK
jgi:hypothetical protein